jgi:negative regulator of sigma E activity
LRKTLNPTGRVGPYGTYDPRALAKLMKGGWKEVEVSPEEEGQEDEKRWWDAAWRAEGFEQVNRERVERLGRRL